jgi:hypothetical protein
MTTTHIALTLRGNNIEAYPDESERTKQKRCLT